MKVLVFFLIRLRVVVCCDWVLLAWLVKRDRLLCCSVFLCIPSSKSHPNPKKIEPFFLSLSFLSLSKYLTAIIRAVRIFRNFSSSDRTAALPPSIHGSLLHQAKPTRSTPHYTVSVHIETIPIPTQPCLWSTVSNGMAKVQIRSDRDRRSIWSHSIQSNQIENRFHHIIFRNFKPTEI